MSYDSIYIFLNTLLVQWPFLRYVTKANNFGNSMHVCMFHCSA